MLVPSPTYAGVGWDLSKNAQIVHERGLFLIVDEAHGAHFSFGAGNFPESALQCGADLVIQSLHKTLPSLTQTAILHLQGERVSRGRLERCLQMYQSSSPSYLFMAGMDACIDLLREQGAELFAEYRRRLDAFYRDTADLAQLHVMRREDLCKEEAYDWDDSKLIIYAGAMGGEALQFYKFITDKEGTTERYEQSKKLTTEVIATMEKIREQAGIVFPEKVYSL